MHACMQVSFTLNGRELGVAFEDIRVFEPQLAYFPAVSLSEGEAAYVNVGQTPLRFPVAEFRPMQAPPPAHRALQCSWLLEKMSSTVCSVQSATPIVCVQVLPLISQLSPSETQKMVLNIRSFSICT